MNLTGAVTVPGLPYFPRASGDEPPEDEPRVFHMAFSPREWG